MGELLSCKQIFLAGESGGGKSACITSETTGEKQHTHALYDIEMSFCNNFQKD